MEDTMSAPIRIRVCLAVVDDRRILLVPNYKTDVGPVQWVIPGGQLAFGESLEKAAVREFFEETGLHAKVTGLLDVSEVILPQRPYHSVSITFSGQVTDGRLRPEADHPYGEKTSRWFSLAQIRHLQYHPKRAVEKALGIDVA